MSQTEEIVLDTELKSELRGILPSSEIGIGHVEYGLVLIENSERAQGLILGRRIVNDDNYPRFQNVAYIRVGDKLYQFNFDEIRFGIRAGGRGILNLISIDMGSVLPLPSLLPYITCELTEEQYNELSRRLTSSKMEEVENGLGLSLEILVKNTDYPTKRQDTSGFRRTVLVTPAGYGDQEREWYKMQDRFRGFT